MTKYKRWNVIDHTDTAITCRILIFLSSYNLYVFNNSITSLCINYNCVCKYTCFIFYQQIFKQLLNTFWWWLYVLSARATKTFNGPLEVLNFLIPFLFAVGSPIILEHPGINRVGHLGHTECRHCPFSFLTRNIL